MTSPVNPKIVELIRNKPEVSDLYLVCRRIIPELLDISVIDDASRGLRGTKEPEERKLIAYIGNQLGNVPQELFDEVNEGHDEIFKGLRELNELYEAARSSNDPFIIREARLGLLMDVIKQHPSKSTLLDFTNRIDLDKLTETHSGLLTMLFFDLNPKMGYLIRQDNDIDITNVVEALKYVEINKNENPIKYCPDSELSMNLMQQFITECKNNDGKIEEIEANLVIIYGNITFGYSPSQIQKIAEDMLQENKCVEMMSHDIRRTPRLKLDSDLEKKARKRVLQFVGVTNKAFEDNNFTPQEEAICERASKYFGIREKAAYGRIIDYCKKKVVIANGNSLVSNRLAKILNKTAITPITLHVSDVIDYLRNNHVVAVVVDLDKGMGSIDFISSLKEGGFKGRIYGTKSRGIRPGKEKEISMEYGVDMCFSPFNATGMREYISNDFGIKAGRS